MPSEPYGDFTERLKEAVALLRVGLSTDEPTTASACSKGAVVLAAAALERYMNDIVHKLCSEIRTEEWDRLPVGQQRYLTKQIARRIHDSAEPILMRAELPEERAASSLRKAIVESYIALENPSRWTSHVEFGLFTSGKGAVERIPALLREFSGDGRDPYQELDEIGWDRSLFLRALGQLIDARHAAAHALPESIGPGPKDAQSWIVLAFWLVRRLEKYIYQEAARS